MRNIRPRVFVWAAVAALAPLGTAQLQFAELGKQQLPAHSDATRGATLGDVDGDGDIDVIFANEGQNRLYLNGGTGLFTDATSSRMPTDDDDTQAVVLGDVDGDGDADLVFGNYQRWDGFQHVGGRNRLYLNDGAGNFTDATQGHLPPSTDATEAVALGDVDGDGDLDLVFATYREFDGHRSLGGQNSLFLNDGSGVFANATAGRMPAYSDNTLAVALGDVDGDGDGDLVFGNNPHWDGSQYVGGQNRLYVNDGTGTFTDVTALRMPFDNEESSAVALGDLDRDGDADLVFANRRSRNHLYLNDGNGKFSDGTAGRLLLYREDTFAVAIGDMNRDGHADVVFGNGPRNETNRFYLGRGSGNFSEEAATRLPSDRDETLAVAMGDVDFDGHVDLVLANGSGQNRLYLNDGAGIFSGDATAPRMPHDPDDAYGLAMGDVDGDGDADLVWGLGSGRDRLYLNDGTGSFTDATAARMPLDIEPANDVALGDVDGDGDLDAIFVGFETRLYLNDGTGTFTNDTASRMPQDRGRFIFALVLGDVDGDNDLDVVAGRFGERNRLYLNDGTGTFTDATAAHLPPHSNDTFSLALGDVDGDGDNDLVFGTQRLTQYPLYLNDGAGFFTDATAGRMPSHSDIAFAVALGDVDGDGDNDLVFGNDGKQNRLYLNDGAGFFTDATAGRMPPDSDSPLAVVLGDVDEDGDPDLVFGNKEAQNRLYLNDGTGVFADATTRIPPDTDETYSVVLGDVDGDGDSDLVFGNYRRPNRLLFNFHRQVHTPLLPILTRTFTMEFHAKPGYGGSSHTVIPAVSLALAPTPLSVPPLGFLYLNPNGVINLPRVAIPASTGVGTLDVTVPADTSLVGQTVYVQALIVNDAQPEDAHLTSYTADLIIK